MRCTGFSKYVSSGSFRPRSNWTVLKNGFDVQNSFQISSDQSLSGMVVIINPKSSVKFAVKFIVAFGL
jgi:hypothetical protein